MPLFEGVVDEYESARPSYPDALYDALGPLGGLSVLDVGAGTGIATGQLRACGASVVALDHGWAMLSRARSRIPGLRAVLADGAGLPFRGASFDLICFAQAWHWLDEATRCLDAHRVLRESGRWAAWWSHARADGQDWFDSYWSIIEAGFPGTHRGQRDIDWGAGVAGSGLFDVGDRMIVAWRRVISVDDWMTELASHSYIATLPGDDRRELLLKLRSVVDRQFPDGAMAIPYETWLWIGRKL